MFGQNLTECCKYVTTFHTGKGGSGFNSTNGSNLHQRPCENPKSPPIPVAGRAVRLHFKSVNPIVTRVTFLEARTLWDEKSRWLLKIKSSWCDTWSKATCNTFCYGGMKLTGILKAQWDDVDRIHLAHDRDHWLYNDVNNQEDARTFSFITLFKSALHVSGDKFVHPQDHFLTEYTAIGTMNRSAAVSVHCTKSCIYSQKGFLRMGKFVVRNM